MALVIGSTVGAATARELPPLEYARCHAIAVNQGFVAEPTDEYDRAVLFQGHEILDRDGQGLLENTQDVEDTAEARGAMEVELYEATDCQTLIGVAPR